MPFLVKIRNYSPEVVKMSLKNVTLYLKCHSFTGVFKHFANKNQLPDFYINRTLVEKYLFLKFWLKRLSELSSAFQKQ